MTLKNNRAPLLCCFQLCAWFHCHMWIQTGVRVRKRLSWVLTSVTLTFDLWPWPFAWTSLLTMVITPENFMMIRWWEHGEKGVTDRQTDGQTDRQTENTICWAAWSQLKSCQKCIFGLVKHNKANLKDLITATGLVIFIKSDPNCRLFSSCDLHLMDDYEKQCQQGTSSMILEAMCHFITIREFKLKLSSERIKIGAKS